jgi:ABC-type Zn uptake system ZnuABC Zn-binding protein ZnuA
MKYNALPIKSAVVKVSLKGIAIGLLVTLMACAETSTVSTSGANGSDPANSSEVATTNADNPSPAIEGDKPLVVTTVAPITNIVSNIAGDRIQVVGLVPEGTNSHTFEPRPSDGEILAQADLVLVNGLSLEVPSMEMAEAVKQADTAIYEVGTNSLTQEQWLYDNSFPKSGGKPNPHLWVSPAYAQKYAEEAAKQLTALDPAGKETYEANLAKFSERIKALDEVTRAVVDSIPAENRKLLTYHDSWPYWARDYGFEVIGAVQPSDFSEPSAQEISSLIDQIKESKVPAIFGSEVFPSKISEQIAREANVKLFNTSDDDLPGEGSANAVENAKLMAADPKSAVPEHTYFGMMADNLRIMAEALGGDPSLVDGLDVTNLVN